MWSRNIIYISAMTTHMTHIMYNIVFILFTVHWKTHGIVMNGNWIWSDGCEGKFKSSWSVFWLCLLHRKKNIKHHCNFFETGHGKGEHDGAGTCVKWELRRHQMNHYADRFVCANQFVQWFHVNLIHECNQKSNDVCIYELCFQNKFIQLWMNLTCTSSNILHTCT